MPRLRRCLRVLDFASDIDPGPDLSGRGAVLASDERSGALALPGELLPAAPCYVDIFSRRVSPKPLTFRDFMQKTAHASPIHGAQTDVGNREFLHEYNAVCGKTGVKHHCRTTLNLKSR